MVILGGYGILPYPRILSYPRALRSAKPDAGRFAFCNLLNNLLSCYNIYTTCKTIKVLCIVFYANAF